MKHIFATFSMVICGLLVQGQNPIVPAGVYIADPSAHQWKDGKMYIYGSRDETTKYYCSGSYQVLSSSDLKNWSISEPSFESIGENDQVHYSNDLLFAPDSQYKDGKYYLYYCLSNNRNTEGVAVSTSPVGSFRDARIIKTFGHEEIDPCVFIDDDGQAYYIWGQFTAKMAKMKPNMMEIDSSSIITGVVTEKEHFFHEGGYMVKRNGIYYFIYAHMGRAGKPTCIGYATSKNPMGPFRYGGVIIDNDHCDPGVWNNHGSIAEFNGNWYVFYHRSTHNSEMMRKACIEPIQFNADGSIPEVEMTSQGVAGPFTKGAVIEAEQACLLYGNVRVEAFSENEEKLTKIINNDCAGYKYIDFGEGIDSIYVTVLAGEQSGRIELVLDNSWGQSIGSVSIPAALQNQEWKTYAVPLRKTRGIHALWFRFRGEGNSLLQLDKFRLSGL